MKRRLLAAMLMLLAATGTTQNVPLGARLKLHWGRDTVTFTDGAHPHTIAIRDQFSAAHLETVKLESAKEWNAFIYLLLDVTGPSKDQPDSHQCGAGSESDLVWLKLDQDWKVVKAQNVRYDSCWSTISVNEGPAWKGDTLTVSADNIKDKDTVVTVTASYSFRRPDDGIKIVESPPQKIK